MKKHKTIITVAVLAVLLAGALPAVAADSDLLVTKIKIGLAGLVDAIASESPSTTSHAQRLKRARDIAVNLEGVTASYYPRVLSAYPSSADICVVGSLDKSVRCSNATSQADVSNEVIALYGNDILLGLGD